MLQEKTGSPGFAVLLLIMNILVIVPGYIFYYKKLTHPIVSKRLPKIVLLQIIFFFISSLIELSFFDTIFSFWYTIIPCPLYTVAICAFSTTASILTLTRQCVFYSMARSSFSEQWGTGYLSRFWDAIFDGIAKIVGTEDYKKFQARNSELKSNKRRGSIVESKSSIISNSGGSNKRLIVISVVTFIVGGLSSLAELLVTEGYDFESHPSLYKADCGEPGTVSLTVLGSFMIISSTVMALRLFQIRDLLGFGIEITLIAFLPKVWYIVFWLSEEATAISDTVPRVLFSWLAIMFEMLIPLYFPMLMVWRFDKLQLKMENGGTKHGFMDLWADPTTRKCIIATAEKQFCTENTEFLVDVEKLETIIKEPHVLDATLKMLYKKYLENGANMELNLSGTIMKEARMQYKESQLKIEMLMLVKVKVIEMLLENTIPFVKLADA